MSDYSYSDQLIVLRNLKLTEGETIRMDCPFCGGTNSFGVSKMNGVIQWNCFRVSCQVKDRRDYGQSVETLKKRLKGNRIIYSKDNVVAETLTSISRRPDIIEWLTERHCIQAYTDGLIDIRYSPTEDRIMFPVVFDKKLVGYTGRSIHSRPKWNKYGDTTHLFTCGFGSIGVLVEDAASACAVGVLKGVTGLSILGTKLSVQHKLELSHYKQVLVCLDPDATSTGMDMVKKLSGYTDASLRFIDDDLKYFSGAEIAEMLSLAT